MERRGRVPGLTGKELKALRAAARNGALDGSLVPDQIGDIAMQVARARFGPDFDAMLADLGIDDLRPIVNASLSAAREVGPRTIRSLEIIIERGGPGFEATADREVLLATLEMAERVRKDTGIDFGDVLEQLRAAVENNPESRVSPSDVVIEVGGAASTAAKTVPEPIAELAIGPAPELAPEPATEDEVVIDNPFEAPSTRAAQNDLPPHPDYEKDAAFFETVSGRIGPLSPIIQPLQFYKTIIEGHSKAIEPALAAFLKQIGRDIKNPPKGFRDTSFVGNITCPQYVYENLMKDWGNGELKETIYWLELLGAFSETRPVHINDIAGGPGFGFLFCSLVRAQEIGPTFGSCYDAEAQNKKVAEYLKKTMPDLYERFKFIKGEVREDTQLFVRKEAGLNLWIIKRPEDATSHVVKRLKNLKREECPDGIALEPCSCCSYKKEHFPGTSTSLTQEEWESLGTLIDKYGDYSVESNEGGLVRKVQTFLNQIFARSINEANQDLHAEVYANIQPEYPQSALIIKPK